MKKVFKILLLIVPWLPTVWLISGWILPKGFFSFDQRAYQMVALFIITVPVLVYYLIHISKNDHLSSNGKVNWYFFNFFLWSPAVTIYWFKYINHDQNNAVQLKQT